MTTELSKDLSSDLADQVKHAYANEAILNIRGGDTKLFLSGTDTDEGLVEAASTSGHQGIINYEPRELVLTARSGTLLTDIQKTLARNKQMLAFEPPAFGEQATLGGTIACGLSGPRRPYTGSVRDYVLGVRMINGRGEIMRFGGEVMKNVAGYDVSRLMTGAMGTLGLLLDISLKVLPIPEVELTLVQELSPTAARKRMIELARQYLPISAMNYVGRFLSIRLSGTQSTVEATAEKIGGEAIHEHGAFWNDILEQQHPFFESNKSLWRLSLPADSNWLDVQKKFASHCLIDWGGALVWVPTNDAPEKIFSYAEALGGHARLFRQGDDRHASRYQPLSPGLLNWHKKLKHAFDPKGILNPGLMYKEV